MNAVEAHAVIHSLSEPSKMPGYGYGLPTRACKTGSKLRKKKGTNCAICYAHERGHYAFSGTKLAQEARLKAIRRAKWVEAMITLLRKKKVRFFRWHDSGDLQGVDHLRKIVAIAEAIPDMMFWLPTKEKGMLLEYVRDGGKFPRNLIVRLSATLIDSMNILPKSLAEAGVLTCGTHDKLKSFGFACDANQRGGECGPCRTCWDGTVSHVSYPKH